MVMVRRIVVVVFGRVPLGAMVGMPSGMIGLHRKLTRAVRKGPEKRYQGKRT